MSAQIDDYVEYVLKTEALTRKRDDTVYNIRTTMRSSRN